MWNKGSSDINETDFSEKLKMENFKSMNKVRFVHVRVQYGFFGLPMVPKKKNVWSSKVLYEVIGFGLFQLLIILKKVRQTFRLYFPHAHTVAEIFIFENLVI